MEEQAATLTRDFITVLLTNGITFFGVLYLIFSGQIKKLFNRVSKVKNGNTEVDFAHCHEPERRKAYRRESDGVCAEHGRLLRAIENIEKRLEKLEEHSEETWLGQLRNTFYNENQKMPLSDKLYAGLRYVWWGQNGQMKQDVLTVAINNKDVYQAITKLRPELKLEEIEKKYKWPLA